MAAAPDTFSESWHRIAGRRIALRPGVRVQRQFFRGERWHVLYDPYGNQYFRVRAGAWDFLARLRDDKTVLQCWEESLAQQSAETPGQEEVIQLLSQLYHANLIRSDMPPDAALVFERHRKRKRRELRTRLLSLLFVRIPLVDPDLFLQRTLPLVRWLFSWFGVALWVAVVAMGVKAGADHWDRLWSQGQSILSPGNIAWLYVALVFLKLLHEMGHAYACRYFGGEVHTLGVMILVFSPMPFVDATSAWGFRNRWHRAFVGAAGMVVELFLAGLAMLVWASTGPGPVNAVAYNMMFIASVSTLLANANPLLRFDGYYILCDLAGMPNLSQRASRLWRYWTERYLFGVHQGKSPAETRQEAFWLGLYGAVAFVYRTFLFAGILLFVAGQWLLLGAILAIAGLVTLVVVPLGRVIHYLGNNTRIERVRRRAIAVTAGGLAAIVTLLAAVPVPDAFTAPGIVRGEQYTVIHTTSEGWFREMPVPSGTRVKEGELLMRLTNRELEIDLQSLRAGEQEALAMEQAAVNNPGEGLAATRERLAAVRQRLAQVERLQRELELRAPRDAVWVAPDVGDLRGRWIPRGMAVGELVDESDPYFSAVVRQEDASNLFGSEVSTEGVRVLGEAEKLVRVTRATIIPAQQQVLPSAALGWQAGGDVAVQSGDQAGTRAVESFFELRATLDPSSPVRLLHGRTGELRCALPPRPLLSQWFRDLRQLLQRRFQI
jgi:putative peptide zinc metalloprotease protein